MSTNDSQLLEREGIVSYFHFGAAVQCPLVLFLLLLFRLKKFNT